MDEPAHAAEGGLSPDDQRIAGEVLGEPHKAKHICSRVDIVIHK